MVELDTDQAIGLFQVEMNRVIDEHEEKKGDSWKICDIEFLIEKLDEEYTEFKKERRPFEKARELIDVANVCAFLYHRFNDLGFEKLHKKFSEDDYNRLFDKR